MSAEKILAIETSGGSLGLALAEGHPFKLKEEIFLETGPRHSELLKESCREIMERCGWGFRGLTRIAVSTGPGSFTGLRVGITFARTLAQFLKIPLVGIPVFEILAVQNSCRPLCILIDSIGGECFAGCFKAGGSRPLFPYQAMPLPRLEKRLARGRSIHFAGEGALLHRQTLETLFGRRARFLPRRENFPRARTLARLALEGARGKKLSSESWRKVLPLYLRPPLAVERLKR